jgi:CubicO group peptidase (beta-lactamase class C family)
MKILFSILIFCSTLSYNQDIHSLDSLINSGIENKLFPAASVIIGNKTDILYHKAFGRQTYESGSPPAEVTSMFDLASVTKAYGTNLCIMKLIDEDLLELDDPVSIYLPEYSHYPKSEITIKNLLLHDSGLPSYYSPKEGELREVILDSVRNKPLVYETGTRTIYSCLNFITLMLVVEKITSKTLQEYYRINFVEPMELTATMFTPGENYRQRCMPSSSELQGVVHDPLARGLEGQSGNAGLFSSSGDLSVICQMLLNGGRHNGKKILSEETIELFSKRNSDKSTRALGFDTKADTGYSSAGTLFSNISFGHTGYTGTSIWIDPDREIYAVLLTNRVYPDDKASIKNFRAEVHDTIIKALHIN